MATTTRLIQLCVGYFLTYLLTGVLVKYFQGAAERGFPGMSEPQYLVYSTVGGSLLCLVAVAVLGWWKVPDGVDLGRLARVLIPSGLCTAVVIPATTLLYSLPITVMVAMVVMRGSIIVVSRLVDTIQIRQGILMRRVYGEENVAVGFALAAVGVHLVGTENVRFTPAAAAILGAYVVAYAVRIYLMNWFKNVVRGTDNRTYFALEQVVASAALALGLAAVVWTPSREGVLLGLSEAVRLPHPQWGWGAAAGSVFGVVAFFSVFIFLFPGRTATFAGLVNRLTSLVAGTAATLVSAVLFGSSFPKPADWMSLGLIFVAVGFLTQAERRRARELAAA